MTPADPTVMLVLGTALASAFNPYNIGMFVALCSVIYGRGHKTSRVLSLGIAYVTTIALATFAAGVGLIYLFNLLPLIVAHYLAIGIGVLTVCAGLLHIKDFFWYGRGISIPTLELTARTMKTMTKARPRLSMAIALGLFVIVVTIPTSSAPYMALAGILRHAFNSTAIGLLGLYGIMCIFPLCIMLILITRGLRVSSLLRWKEKAKGFMRLGAGLVFIALGWIAILNESGVLNFE